MAHDAYRGECVDGPYKGRLQTYFNKEARVLHVDFPTGRETWGWYDWDEIDEVWRWRK